MPFCLHDKLLLSMAICINSSCLRPVLPKALITGAVHDMCIQLALAMGLKKLLSFFMVAASLADCTAFCSALVSAARRLAISFGSSCMST